MKNRFIQIFALASLLVVAAYAVETTLAPLPSNTFAAPVTTVTQAHVDALNAVVSAQNANNTSLRASLTSILTGGATLVSNVLTTPTLNNPVIIGPAPVACGASCSPTAGQLVLLNQGAGSTVTIPTSAGTGNVIQMRISVITGSGGEKVLLATTSDAIIGTASGFTGSTAKIFVGNASTYHSIQMPYTGSQPSGGFVGDTITCTDIAAGTWACDVQYQAGTTPTTPYSASTT